MRTIWIAKANDDEYGVIYLPHHAALSENDCRQSILRKAREEGFRGTSEERLEELGWEVIEVELIEVS